MAKKLVILAIAALMTACSQAGHNGTSPVLPQSNTGPASHVRPLDTLGGGSSYSQLRVTMGDSAPQLGGKTLQHLYLGIWRIDVSSNGRTGTLAAYSSPDVIDVLAYQDNNAAVVGSGNVATQNYDHLTFVVDLASSYAVFSDGSSSPISFMTNTATHSTVGAGSTTTTIADGPNAVDVISTQSFAVPAGQPQAVRVDFNAFESLALQNGTLVSNPALFLAPTAHAGQIAGTVVNRFGRPVQNATIVAKDAAGNIGNTTMTDQNGAFSMGSLNAGAYKISVYNSYTNASGQQYSATGQSNQGWTGVYGPAVNVQAGVTTNTGNITD